MSRRPTLVTGLALVLASSGAHAAGRGISLSGFAGAGYLLSTGSQSPYSHLDFSGGLSLNGGLLNPDLLRWAAAGSYAGSRGFGSRSTSAANGIAFRTNFAALSRTAVPVSFVASRTYADVTSGPPDAQVAGNTVTTAFCGTATLRLRNSPTVFGTLGRTLVETERAGAGRVFTGSTRLSTGISQNLSRFEYATSYDTGWVNGTFAEQNYRSHLISARAAASLSESLRFNVFDSYYLRLPTNELPGNPRFDTNNLGAGLQWLATRKLTGSVTYGHQQTLIVAPTQAPVENRSHQVQQSLTYQLSEDLALGQSLTVLNATASVGAATRSGWGESLGLGLLWQRPLRRSALSASLNGNVGLVQPDTGGLETSYGASAGGSAISNFSWGAGSVAYSVGYSSGGPAVSGYTFQQLVRLEASYRPGGGATLRGYFNASVVRREDSFLGTFLNRNLTATVDFSSRQFLAQLSGGVTDGVNAALANPGWGGGLFLPVSYNTHSRYLQLRVSTSLDRGRLGLCATARLAENRAPNRPTDVSGGVTASVTYAIGKFRIGLEDRLMFGGFGSVSSVENVLMARLSRDFAWEIF